MNRALTSDGLSWRRRLVELVTREHESGAASGHELISDERPVADWQVLEYSRAADVPATHWDAIAAGVVVRSHRYLSAMEACSASCGPRYYLRVEETPGRAVAEACISLVETDFLQLMPSWFVPFARVWRRLFPGFLKAYITECGAPMVAAHGVAIEADKVDASSIMKLLDGHCLKIAKRHQSPLIVFRDVKSDEANLFDGLLQCGYRKVSSMPLAEIDVDWQTYEGYLAAMRRRYRKDLRRRLRRGAGAGNELIQVEDIAVDAELWAAQANVIYSGSSSFKRERLNSSYYAEMGERLADSSELVAVNRENKPVAHGIVLHDEATTIATFFGRREGKPQAEWFQLINEVIRRAILRGSRTIHLGRGSYEAKSLVGAKIKPLYAYCKSSNLFLRFLMRVVPSTMEPERTSHHHIFK